MRVLICSFGSPGFLFPLVGLARELMQRGHEVRVLSNASARGVVEGAGVPLVDSQSPTLHGLTVTRWAHPLSIAVDVKLLEAAVARFEPHAIVTHYLSLGALIVRERRNIPVAVMGGFSYLFPPSTQPAFVFERSRTWREWRLKDEMQHFNVAREHFGLKPAEANPADHALLGDLFMIRSTAYLERDLSALPECVHAVGPCEWEPGTHPCTTEDEEARWKALSAQFESAAHGVLYVQHGRSFRGPGFWRLFVDAITGAPLQALASVGRMDMELGPLPKNVLAHEHMSQRLVLPRASAVVAMGHSSALIGAVTHALPSVLIPRGGETPDNAERLVAAQCAICLDNENLSVADLRNAIDKVLTDEEIRGAAEKARAAMSAFPSFPLAASLIEAMAINRAPVCRGDCATDAGGAARTSYFRAGESAGTRVGLHGSA